MQVINAMTSVRGVNHDDGSLKTNREKSIIKKKKHTLFLLIMSASDTPSAAWVPTRITGKYTLLQFKAKMVVKKGLKRN